MEKLMPELLTSQAVALVTPLYYFGFSAQIKRVIDRFYACNHCRQLKVVIVETSNNKVK